MSVTVHILKNPLEPKDSVTLQGENAVKIIYDYYSAGTLPVNAQIYHEYVSDATNVTPTDLASITSLSQGTGTYYVVHEAEGPLLLIGALIVGALAVSAFLLLPKVPEIAQRNVQSDSPNNRFGSRSNQARPGSRVPDPFGTNRVTPDLLGSPYKVFVDHTEIEYAYYCIGRGSYAVPLNEIRDGDTPIIDVVDSSLEVYGPGTSPLLGTPELQHGTHITETLRTVYKNNAVNGQTLKASNDENLGSSGVRVSANGFVTDIDSGVVFDDVFTDGASLIVEGSVGEPGAPSGGTETETVTFDADNGVLIFPDSTIPAGYSAGDMITISGADYARVFTYNYQGYQGQYTLSGNLDGVYAVSSVSGSSITLTNPQNVNDAWANAAFVHDTEDDPLNIEAEFTGASSTGATFVDLSGTYTIDGLSATNLNLLGTTEWSTGLGENYFNANTGRNDTVRMYTTNNNWNGPFSFQHVISELVINVVALQGMFKDNGENQTATSVSYLVEVQPVNEDGLAVGNVTNHTYTVRGSSLTKDQRAHTARIPLNPPTRVSVRVRRTTAKDLRFEGTVVDEIKLRDMYGMVPVTTNHFGDVTTVYTRTVATPTALSVKERKLNMRVTRKVPRYDPEVGVFSAPEATIYGPDIFVAVATDPYIGNRQLNELDLEDIYDVGALLTDYFGTNDVVAFSYTFDKNNLSYQETAEIIARAMFCSSYRRGAKISLYPETAVDDSAMLFNHRNKLPGTEVRTISFGIENDYDGVDIVYVDPQNDEIVTYNIPEDRTALNALEIETIGVREPLQAYFTGWRAYRKMLYQHTTTSFTATQEADLLNLRQAVLVADNTKAEYLGGDVLGQAGLVLTLSQKHGQPNGTQGTIYLQLSNGTVQGINCTVISENTVSLAAAPTVPLVIDPAMFVQTVYTLSFAGVDDNAQRFIITEKEPNGDLTTDVVASNYDDRYYTRDKDYIDDIVGLDLNIRSNVQPPILPNNN